MAFDKFNGNSGGGFTPRKMVQGNWKCADCGKEITELPLEPYPDRTIYCRDCRKKKRDFSSSPRKMVQGNWKCADCGKEISELPFEPSPDTPICCKDCWLKRKNQGN